jgi:hypothetical protein
MRYILISINPIDNIRKIVKQYPSKEHALAYAVHKMTENINKGCCSIFIKGFDNDSRQYGSNLYLRKYDSLVSCVKNCSLCIDNKGCGDIYKVEKVFDSKDNYELK